LPPYEIFVMGPSLRASSLVLVAAALGTSACSSGSNAKSSSPAASVVTNATAANGSTITIKNFAFTPKPLMAKVGATVAVHNADSTAHTITADDKSFDTGNIEASGQKTITVAKAGTFAYHCNIHNYMTGVIQVAS
jgi:plastocyanin